MLYFQRPVQSLQIFIMTTSRARNGQNNLPIYQDLPDVYTLWYDVIVSHTTDLAVEFK